MYFFSLGIVTTVFLLDGHLFHLFFLLFCTTIRMYAELESKMWATLGLARTSHNFRNGLTFSSILARLSLLLQRIVNSLEILPKVPKKLDSLPPPPLYPSPFSIHIRLM